MFTDRSTPSESFVEGAGERNLHPVALIEDIKQAFLQVRIRIEDRDLMRLHWYKNIETKEKITLRFTKALFGLSPSPFLL